jgi:hypothetical protein
MFVEVKIKCENCNFSSEGRNAYLQFTTIIQFWILQRAVSYRLKNIYIRIWKFIKHIIHLNSIIIIQSLNVSLTKLPSLQKPSSLSNIGSIRFYPSLLLVKKQVFK